MGVGFCEGLDLGTSTKGAVIAQGLQEIQRFASMFAPAFKVSKSFLSLFLVLLSFDTIGGNFAAVLWCGRCDRFSIWRKELPLLGRVYKAKGIGRRVSG